MEAALTKPRRKLGRKATRETVARRDQLQRLIAGTGNTLTRGEIAARFNVNESTVDNDLRWLRAHVPQAVAEDLPAHVFVMLDRSEGVLLAALNAAAKPDPQNPSEMVNPKEATRLAMRLSELQERRADVGLKVGVLKREAPSWAIAARVDPRTQAFEFVLANLPQVTDEQQAALLKAGERLIIEEENGVES